MVGRATLALLAVCASTALADSEPAVLEIPARSQAAESPREGWCAETAIQEAMAHYGAYVPQRLINRAGEPRHPDLYWGDIPRALERLGIERETWSGRGGQRAFTAWARQKIAGGNPVIAGVKLYPTRQPRWGLDHIVLIAGVESDGAMRINTTWGYQVRRTREQLASRRRGMSLANRYDRQFAHAITGLAGASGPPVSLLLGERRGDRINARLRLRGLVRGGRYEILRDGAAIRTVVARGPTASIAVRIDARKPARFRARRLAGVR